MISSSESALCISNRVIVRMSFCLQKMGYVTCFSAFEPSELRGAESGHCVLHDNHDAEIEESSMLANAWGTSFYI